MGRSTFGMSQQVQQVRQVCFFLKWKQTLWFVATNICLYDFYLFDYEAGNWDFTLFLDPSFDSE